MAKPHPALLDPARYPFDCAMATRFADLDTNRHLNNVALMSILEDARVRFHQLTGFHAAMSETSAMLASMAVEYLGQAYYPLPLHVFCAIASVGRSSFVLQQLGTQQDRTVIFARSVMVCVAGGRPAALPGAFTDGIAGWMLRP